MLDFLVSLKAATDKLESFPWIKASKAKARFGTTASPQLGQATEAPPQAQPEVPPQNLPLVLTNKMLQDYVAAITASLQPYVVPDSSDTESASIPAPQPQALPISKGMISPKRPLTKGKVPKAVTDEDVPATTESYWDAERKMYPDSFYDEFYLDWLRKRQVGDAPVALALNQPEPEETTETSVVQPQMSPAGPSPQAMSSVPLGYNPYLVNPFMYPLAGMKVSKAMMQAQVNAALTALNITTTAKPVKIKLKIPIPAGSDLAQVVSSGIAGFPSGTTYELSKK